MTICDDPEMGLLCWMTWLLEQHEFAVLGDLTVGAPWVCCAGWPDCWGNMSLLCWVTGPDCWATWVCCAGWPDLTVGATWVCCAGWPGWWGNMGEFAVLGDLIWLLGQHECCAGWPGWWGNMGEFAVLGDLTWLLGNVGLLCWVIWQFGLLLGKHGSACQVT